MMRSLFSGVSGLKNHQTRMDTIGNNISNVNTTGFKSSRTTFVDTLSQTLSGASSPNGNIGGTNAKQIGLGSSVASVDLLFTDGSVQSTGKNTDLCLSGSGLFVVHQGSSEYYTRNGNFEFDADGNYVLAGTGYYVQGWMATDGVLNTSAGVTSIQIPAGKSMASKATDSASYSLNLNASTATIVSISGGTNQVPSAAPKTITSSSEGSVKYDSSIPAGQVGAAKYFYGVGAGKTQIPIGDLTTGKAYSVGDVVNGNTITEIQLTVAQSADATASDPITLAMSDGTTQTVSSGSYTLNHSIPVATVITVYDSLGTAHTVPINIEKSGNNEWTATLATTSITESDGSTTTLALDGGKVVVPFTSSGAYNTATGLLGKLTMTYGNGAATQNISVDFSPLTQYSGSNTVNGAANGNAAGVLESVSIDNSGIITGTYSNGVIQYEAQVAVAQFNNAAGLTKTGTSLYQKSNNSGTVNIKTASDLGCTITPSALEMSNVDIANEFSDMIVTQRGFQSNSKIITVSDEMLETLINMKR